MRDVYFGTLFDVTDLSAGIVVPPFFSWVGSYLPLSSITCTKGSTTYLPKPNGIRRFHTNCTAIHHDFPKDKQRLAMPPVMSIVIATTLLLILETILGKYAFSSLAGFLVGYASYLIVHYSVHIYRPPKNFLKSLWKNHAIHHYKDDTILFGVSSPIWDYVYGSLPKTEVEDQVVERLR